eukprot:179626-Prymnesium_polylepis.2
MAPPDEPVLVAPTIELPLTIARCPLVAWIAPPQRLLTESTMVVPLANKTRLLSYSASRTASQIAPPEVSVLERMIEQLFVIVNRPPTNAMAPPSSPLEELKITLRSVMVTRLPLL